MKLTTRVCDAVAPSDKERLLSDGYGLYLRVRPDAAKTWLFVFTSPGGTRRKQAFGPYPTVSLVKARELANDARMLLAAGKDPQAEKIVKRATARKRDLSTFEVIGRAWHKHAQATHEWSESYSSKILRMLELHAFPSLGRYALGLILQAEILDVLHRVAKAGTRETATRLREKIQLIYAYAVTQGVIAPAENFMAPGVANFKLPTPRRRHHAALLDPPRIGQLLRDCHAYTGHFITRCALQLMPLLFQRPGQVRKMEWSQLNLDTGIWRCPPEIMKMTNARRLAGDIEDHIVPLPAQAVAILRDLYSLTGPTGPVFKSVSRRSEKSRFISDNTINAALRAMGYDTQKDITGHGFRAMARSLIRERLGWDKEVIERHLAHGSSEELGEAYDRTRFIDQRRQMVQAWADYLDELATTTIRPAALATSA